MKSLPLFLGIFLAVVAMGLCAPVHAQLPSLIPPVEVSAGAFKSGSDQDGFAVKATASMNVIGDHGVAASAWYLHGDDMNFYALTGEYRKRFGPFSIAYWALGGGVGKSDGTGSTMDDGAVVTAGIGAQLAGINLEARALSSVGGGTAGMLMVGYKF